MEVGRRRAREALFLLVMGLQACGGGGGGHGSPQPPDRDTSGTGKSLEQLITIYDGLADAAYKGQQSAATLSGATILPFARAVLSDEFPLAGNARLAQAAPRERVDTTEPCDNEDGSRHSTGTLDDAGMGALDVTYSNCLQGEVLVNGHSVLYFGESPAPEYQFFDNTSWQVDGQSLRLNGRVHDQSSAGTTFDVVLSNEKTGAQLRLSQYREVQTIAAGEPAETQVNGTLYLPAQGKVDVTGHTLVDAAKDTGTGELTLTDAARTVVITLNGADADLRLAATATPEEFSVARVATRTLLHYDSVADIRFYGLQEVGNAPRYSEFHFTQSSYWTRDAIETGFDQVWDEENNPVTVTYAWSVNGVTVAGQQQSVLPGGNARAGDVVSVVATLSDGYNLTRTDTIETTLNDSLPELIAEDLPAELSVGEGLAAHLAYGDPDDPAHYTSSLQLAYGPASARIDRNGVLRWTPSRLLLGGYQIFHFGIGVQGSTETPVDLQVKVVDASRATPLARAAALNIRRFGNSLASGRFDDDTNDRLFAISEAGLLYSLARQNDDYVQTWAYPFAPSAGESLLHLQLGDINGDGNTELFLASRHDLYTLASKAALLQQRYSIPFDTEINDMKVADLDNDGHPEVSLLSLSSAYGEPNIIIVLDTETFAEKARLEVPYNVRYFAVGNVDADPAREILLPSGTVFDGSSFEQEWNYTPGFGSKVRTADIDGDGVDEIVFAPDARHVSLVSALSKNELTRFDTASACRVWGADLSAQPGTELFFGCEDGSVKLYRFADPAHPALLGERTMAAAYVSEVATGDLDHDGQPDVAWGGVTRLDAKNFLAVVSPQDEGWGWIRHEEDALGSLNAVGTAQVSPDSRRGVFLASRFDDFQYPQHVVLMNDNGDLQLSPAVASNTFNQMNRGVIADFNQDGDDELLASSGWAINALRLTDFSSLWSFEPAEEELPATFVQAADLNSDGHTDALYGTLHALAGAEPLSHTSLLNLAFDASENVLFSQVFDADADGDPDLYVQTGEQLQLWLKNGPGYVRSTATDVNCDQLVAGMLDGSTSPRLVCLKSDYHGYHRALAIYQSDLSLEKTIVSDLPITTIAAATLAPGQTHLLVSVMADPSGFASDSNSAVRRIGLASGTTIWESPYVVGSINARSLVAGTGADTSARLLFTTDSVMYMSR